MTLIQTADQNAIQEERSSIVNSLKTLITQSLNYKFDLYE